MPEVMTETKTPNEVPAATPVKMPGMVGAPGDDAPAVEYAIAATEQHIPSQLASLRPIEVEVYRQAQFDRDVAEKNVILHELLLRMPVNLDVEIDDQKKASREMDAITKEKDLTEQGKQKKRAATLDRTRRELNRLEERRNALLDAFDESIPEPSWPPPPNDIVGELTLLFMRAQMEAPHRFSQAAADTLRRAIDTKRSGDQIHRDNQRLLHVYGPICEARASAPDGLSRYMVPVYQKLSELIERHLTTQLGVTKFKLARQYSQAVKSEFHTTRGLLRQTKDLRELDSVIAMTAPTITKLRAALALVTK